MATVATLSPTSNPTVSYGRLYTLDGYVVRRPDGVTLCVDHDRHVYALEPEHAAALTALGVLPAPERTHVLAALARCAEVCG